MRKVTILHLVNLVKRKEQEALKRAIKNSGNAVKVNGGYVYNFAEDNLPIIAAYVMDEPCDVVVTKVRLSKQDNLLIEGEVKNDRGYTYNIEPSDIFAGQMDFITGQIGTVL